MENDPNKKESKGKRIFKKALRRTSKSSSNGQAPALDPPIAVSKSLESKRLSLDITASSLPQQEAAKEKADLDAARAEPLPEGKLVLQDALSDALKGKKVEIHESHNETIGVVAPVADTSPEINELFAAPAEPRPSIQDGGKRNLKRKLEEESEAGTSGASAGTSESDADDKDPSKDKKKKNRCAVCRKKVGLTGFECRCGGLFCAVHRYSDKHECSFDYRELGQQEIRRNNPVVVSQKIHKI